MISSLRLVKQSPAFNAYQCQQKRHVSFKEKCTQLVERADLELSKQFPKGHFYLHTFRNGVNDAKGDIKSYVRLTSRVGFLRNKSDDQIRQLLQPLTLKEISVLRKVPMELAKTSAFLGFFLLPGTFIFIPLVFFFPRYLIQYLWTDVMRREFFREEISRRNVVCKLLHNELYQNVSSLRDNDGASLRAKISIILRDISNGNQISEEHVKVLDQSFEKHLPLSALTYLHQICLLEINSCLKSRGMHENQLWKMTLFKFYLHRMQRQCLLMSLENERIMRETNSLMEHPVKYLDELCQLRGLYTIDSTKEEKIANLRQLARIFSHASPKSQSLLLHMPYFWSMNARENKRIML